MTEVTPPKRPPILGPLELGEPIGGLVPPPPIPVTYGPPSPRSTPPSQFCTLPPLMKRGGFDAMDDRGPCPPALERSPSRSRCVCLTIGEVTPPKRPPILGPLELGEPIDHSGTPPPPGHLWGDFRPPRPPILGPLELGEPIDHSGTPPSPRSSMGGFSTPPSKFRPPPLPSLTRLYLLTLSAGHFSGCRGDNRPYFTGFFTNPGGRKSFIGSGGYQGIEGVPPGGVGRAQHR